MHRKALAGRSGRSGRCGREAPELPAGCRGPGPSEAQRGVRPGRGASGCAFVAGWEAIPSKMAGVVSVGSKSGSQERAKLHGLDGQDFRREMFRMPRLADGM